MAYKKSINFVDFNKKESIYTKKTFNSMLAMLERNWAEKDYVDELTEFTFTRHITLLPKDELTPKIFPRLYSFYVDQAKLDFAEATLLNYISQHPKNKVEQKELAKHLVDKYINLENAPAISKWIGYMDQAFLGFNKDEKVKTEIILGQILFKKAGELETAGKSDEALESYLSLYKVEYYPRNIRANAAMKRAILLAKNHQQDESNKWIKLAVDMFEPDELNKQKLTIAGLADYHMLKQSLETAQDISSLVVKTFCKLDAKLAQNHFVKVASLNQQLDEYSDLKSLLKSEQCPMPKELLAQEVNNIFVHWLHTGNSKNLKNFHMEFAHINPQINKLYLSHVKQDLWRSLQENQYSKIKDLVKEMQSLAKNEFSTKDEKAEIELIANSIGTLEALANFKLEDFKFLEDQKEFNEELMMGRLNQSIERLNTIKSSVDELINSKIAEIINFSSAKLTDLYLQQAHFFKAIRINHPDIDYLKSFYDQMASLSESTKQTALKYQATNIAFVQKNKLLSVSNRSLFMSSEDNSLLEEINFKPYLVSVDKKVDNK